MKKLLFSLLLTAHVLSVFCMEKERHYNYNSSDQTMIPVYTLSPLFQMNNQDYYQPGYCQANEPGWEFYDDIMNMTYKNEQSSIISKVPLTPVYKPAQTVIAQQEQKSLLKTNSLQPNNDIMQSLYTTGSHIVFNAYKGSPHEECRLKGNINQKYHNEQFVQIIKDMNNAKNNGINESHMIKFAYKKKDIFSVNDTDLSPLGPIIFILLKKYNATVQKTGEQLPPYSSSQKPSLTEIFNVPNTINTTMNSLTKCDVVRAYPAFFQLIYDLRNATQELSLDAVTIFMKYLCKDNNILLEGYSDGSYKDFKSDFYTKACDVLDLNLLNLFIDGDSDLHVLLQMIDKAKEVEDITNEDDLINHMAAFTDIQSLATQIWSKFDPSYIDSTRKRIVLLCRLIKKYNNERGFKTNPTPNQYHAYCVKKALNVSLPKSLNNKDLLDGDSYAFVEFAELREAYAILRKANEEEITSLF